MVHKRMCADNISVQCRMHSAACRTHSAVAVSIATIYVHICMQHSYNLSHYSPKYMQYWLRYGSIIEQGCVSLITCNSHTGSSLENYHPTCVQDINWAQCRQDKECFTMCKTNIWFIAGTKLSYIAITYFTKSWKLVN